MEANPLERQNRSSHMTTTTQPHPARVGRWAAIVSGIVAAAVAIGVAELLAALGRAVNLLSSNASPLLSLGSSFIDLTPASIVNWAKENLGHFDKPALALGMGVVLLGLSAAVGLLARRAVLYGSILLAVLGAVVVAAIASRSLFVIQDILPTIFGVVAGNAALRALFRAAPLRSPEDGATGGDRRRFLQMAGIGAGAAVASGGLSQLIPTSAAAEASREHAATEASAAAKFDQLPPLPAGVDLKVDGLSPFVTPNGDFYRIDTALVVPKLNADTWELRIFGMVDQEVRINYADLLKRPQIERMVTLTCVSNEIGGDLIGNAKWQGTALADLIREAGPSADADMVMSRSSDGMEIGSPLEVLLDGRDAMLAVAMNGEVLPFEHGFPVRMVVPGLYGYVSATKWVVELEVMRYDQAQAYWTQRGWGAKGPIKTASRIDVPRSFAKLTAGKNAVAGVAWAQHRGISKVEVQVDDSDWAEAKLSTQLTKDTWRQWVYEWDATPGNHNIKVRATDGTGQVQTADVAGVLPDGATGYDSRAVSVS